MTVLITIIIIIIIIIMIVIRLWIMETRGVKRKGLGRKGSVDLTVWSVLDPPSF